MDMIGRRVATVHISSVLMASWLSEGTAASAVTNPLKDMKVIGARFDAWKGCVEILVESPDLEMVKEGGTCTAEYTPVFQNRTMIDGDPKKTILVDIDRVLCVAGEDTAFPEAADFIKELGGLGTVYIYSSRDVEDAWKFLIENGLEVAGVVEKPNPLVIIDDKAETCYGPDDYAAVLEKVRARAKR